ncbi:hypothetical protein AWB78_02399 [Caballeronia calidae]|uniref:Uncharacterized protein n=1 Tax=Caballeronia calidae TaxID=1777139 RepID=A0A158BAC2_9BURK|nr:hypothetical protein AWB78_02399 [Caballeronia calidae]
MNEFSQPSIAARLRLRYHLGDAIRDVVLFGSKFDEAVEHVAVPEADAALFRSLLRSELEHLQIYNCARFRLPMGEVQAWIGKGRPS